VGPRGARPARVGAAGAWAETRPAPPVAPLAEALRASGVTSRADAARALAGARIEERAPARPSQPAIAAEPAAARAGGRMLAAPPPLAGQAPGPPTASTLAQARLQTTERPSDGAAPADALSSPPAVRAAAVAAPPPVAAPFNLPPRAPAPRAEVVIDQLDVRVIAEPPAPAAARRAPAAPTAPGGAWRAAARHYLGTL
jgi:hypothetical protein